MDYLAEFFSDVCDSWPEKSLTVTYIDFKFQIQTQIFKIISISKEKDYGALRFVVEPQIRINHDGTIEDRIVHSDAKFEYWLRITAGAYFNKFRNENLPVGFNDVLISYVSPFGIRMGTNGHKIIDFDIT